MDRIILFNGLCLGLTILAWLGLSSNWLGPVVVLLVGSAGLLAGHSFNRRPMIEAQWQNAAALRQVRDELAALYSRLRAAHEQLKTTERLLDTIGQEESYASWRVKVENRAQALEDLLVQGHQLAEQVKSGERLRTIRFQQQVEEQTTHASS